MLQIRVLSEIAAGSYGLIHALKILETKYFPLGSIILYPNWNKTYNRLVAGSIPNKEGRPTLAGRLKLNNAFWLVEF